MFIGQLTGAALGVVPTIFLTAPASWYAGKKQLSLRSFSSGDKLKMCLAIATTTFVLSTLPEVPIYRTERGVREPP
jgi:hypothetical protein